MPTSHNVLIFLCYARDDRERVSQLYDDLRGEGFSPWMDRRDLLPGEIWEERIRKVINEADFFLACLSQHALDKSGFTQAEIKHALRLWEEKREGDIYLIPVKLEDCQLPESLSKFHFAAIFENEGFPSLVRAIQKGIEEKRTAHDIFERQVQGELISLGYLSRKQPLFKVSLSLFDQYKLENDYLPLLTKSLIEEFDWDEKIVYRILFIIREISVNAFEYGCAGDINRNVNISVRMEMVGLLSERIVINIESPGDGFDISRYIQDEENRKIDDIGGMGLMTTKRASDIFTYSKDGKEIQSIIMKNYDRHMFGETALIMDDIPIVLISPKGRIDHTTAGDFERYMLSKALEVFPDKPASRGIIIDLADVEYMSSAGLRVLMILAREVYMVFGIGRQDSQKLKPIVCCRPNLMLQELFKISRFDLLFPTCFSIEESKDYLRNLFMKR